MKGFGDVIKSERFILFGIVDSESDLAVAINTFLTMVKLVIWRDRNIVKYQKKTITKQKIINSVKNEVTFLFDHAYQTTGKVLFTEIAEAVRGEILCLLFYTSITMCHIILFI